jgi:hypothetical protein
MASSAAKTPLTVVVNINPGPATPAQRAAWRRLWTHLIERAEVGPRDD